MIQNRHVNFETCCLEIQMSVDIRRKQLERKQIKKYQNSLLTGNVFHQIGYARHEFGQSSQ